MKNHIIKSLLLSYLILTSISLHAQISKGGIPRSFNLSINDSVQTIDMPQINIDSLIQSDSISEKNSFRLGIALDVNIGIENNGTWDTLSNGDKIWRLKIQSQNAFSINLIYNDFWLPYGSEFFIYNKDKSMVYGAFTPEFSNNQYNKFATDLIKGETTILEYYEPSYSSGAKINISKVIHGYKNMFKSGHLPEVPTTAEVEEKGIKLGEMNEILLKKVEELTLYVLQQQKEIEELKNNR